MHDGHDWSFLENQLVAHIEPMIEKDEQLFFGPIIGKEQTKAQISSRVVVLANTVHQEVLEPDRIVLQKVGTLEKRGVSGQMQDCLEMMVHSSLGLPIDELQTSVMEASRAAVLLGNSPLQEYIDKACSTGYPFLSLTQREAGFLGQILLMV